MQNIDDDTRTRHLFYQCYISAMQMFVNELKETRMYGIHDPFLEILQSVANYFVAKGTKIDKNTIETAFKMLSSIFTLLDGISEEVVANSQGIKVQGFRFNLLGEIFKDIIHKYQDKVPVFSIMNILGSKKISAEDKIALNNSVNFFLSDLFNGYSEKMKDAVKNLVLNNVIPAVIKRRSGEEVSVEDQKKLFNSFIRMIIAYFGENTSKSLLDKFLFKGQTEEDFNTELRNVMRFMIQNGVVGLNKLGKNPRVSRVIPPECIQMAKEVSCILLTQIPEKLSKQNFDMNAGSWRATQEEQVNEPGCSFATHLWYNGDERNQN